MKATATATATETQQTQQMRQTQQTASKSFEEPVLLKLHDEILLVPVRMEGR